MSSSWSSQGRKNEKVDVILRGGGIVPRLAHNQEIRVQFPASLPVYFGGFIKYCQQMRAGGVCAADAKYQIWRGGRGQGIKRYRCERCLRETLSTPHQRDKITYEAIS